MSDAQIEALSSAFKLTAADLAALNESLAWALNAFNRPRTIDPTIATDGQVVFETALRDIRKAAALPDAAADQLRLLRLSTPVGVDRYVSSHQHLFRRVRTASVNADVAADLFEEAQKAGMSTALREVKDKRKHSDVRRSMVCGAIIRFWKDRGGNVGYSTDAASKERTGPLVDFIRAVVACVTDPSVQLDGETIRKEIVEKRQFLDVETRLEDGKGIDSE